MYAGFLMHRPATNSTASVLFDTHMVDYMENAKRLIATCSTILEMDNPEEMGLSHEEVNKTLAISARDMATRIERLTVPFRVDGWELHSLIDQD